MTPPAPGGVPHATLLAEMSWLRRLARELVGDAEVADDLVQETCVAALEKAPRETPRLRQWLGTVLRNAWRQRLRSGGRRDARERLGARPEAVEGADGLVERVALQRLMAGAVLELEEPYRTTVLLRFFEDLPPREIARRTGVPLATVNSRLQRALTRLRERLDHEQRSWVRCLVPWIRELAPAAPPLVPLLMKTKIAVAAAGVLALAGALYTWNDGASGEPSSERTRTVRDALATTSAPGVPAPAGDADRRSTTERRPALDPAGSSGGAGVGSEAPLWTVNLRVLDAEARPMPGIAVRGAQGADVLGTSGNGGWCVFQTREPSLALAASDSQWVTISEGFAERVSAFDPVLVVAPALLLTGRTVDADGRSLPGARVRVSLPRDFETRFDDVLDATRPQAWVTTSDARGHFDLGAVPQVEGARVRAFLAGFEHRSEPLPFGAFANVDLVLERPAVPSTGVLEGRVIDLSALPVAGARVSLGLASVVTDEQGRFHVDLARAVTTETLTAVQPGFLPAVMERPEPATAGRTGWPDFVELVVGEAALSIRGRVVDQEGEPVAGARLWLDDPTPAAPIGFVPLSLEGLMSGQRIPSGALESAAFLPDQDGDSFWDVVSDEPETPSALWNFVTSDATGDFELTGLADRRYVLRVLGPESIATFRSDPIHAGERSAIVRIASPERYETVSGRVVGSDGRGVPDVSVRLSARFLDLHARVYGGRSQTVLQRSGGRATTDEEGRFTFQDVPREGVRVELRSDDILPHGVELESDQPTIEVVRRCHLQVVLGPSSVDCDAISVRDGDGEPLDLLTLSEGGVQAMTHMPVADGRSAVLAVSEEARRLVLWKDDVEVGEVPIFLVAGEVNRVTP